LFYDATAKDGFHRDLTRNGQVIGANSVFAATLLRSLLHDPTSKVPTASEQDRVHTGIRQAIVDCQRLYDLGYGNSFDDFDSEQIDYAAPQRVLFDLHF
jgi:hypothetical protein